MKTNLCLYAPIFLSFLIVACDNENPSVENSKTYWEYTEFITDGLIAYYPFNGDAKDSSGNRINGTNYGAATSVDRFGEENGSLIFDGVDDFIMIQNKPELNGSEGTICFWSRVPLLNDTLTRAIVSKADTTHVGFVLSVTNSDMYLFTSREITDPTENPANLGADTWEEGRYFFFAVTFTVNSRAFYCEGYRTSLLTYSSEKIFNDNEADLYIGKSMVTVTNSFIDQYHFFKGEIDDILIYNRALSDDEILQLYRWN